MKIVNSCFQRCDYCGKDKMPSDIIPFKEWQLPRHICKTCYVTHKEE